MRLSTHTQLISVDSKIDCCLLYLYYFHSLLKQCLVALAMGTNERILAVKITNSEQKFRAANNRKPFCFP